ncbi:hypothetical protein LCGC14_1560820 [marine sediment metagenome]|uniref:Uncharacterized protein n=1 Tax=marine sediment metagenome TaxID=412755 RepID=A0A0F9IMI4_9ZZZZ
MKERLSTILIVSLLVGGNILFFFYLQTNAALCDGLGYPVCP